MSQTTEANKQRVREIIERVVNGGEIELADAYYREDYIQHNPHVAQGRAGLKKLLSQMHASGNPRRAEIVLINAEDDMVWALLRWSGGDVPAGTPTLQVSTEIFRVEDGMMAEHWDCVQIGPDPA
jgi:predicted SnoaL-like aldol condensation-catalyzing enzyme